MHGDLKLDAALHRKVGVTGAVAGIDLVGVVELARQKAHVLGDVMAKRGLS
jgi:hypothetical protein